MSDKNIYESLIEHARIALDAERENADRIYARHKLLITALAILFGLGLFKVEWVRSDSGISRINSAEWNYAIRAMLSAAVVAFGYAFLRSRRGQWLAQTNVKSVAGTLSIGFSVLLICSGAATIFIEAKAAEPRFALVIGSILAGAMGSLNLVALRKAEKLRPSDEEVGVSPDPATASHHLHLDQALIDEPDAGEGEILELIYYSTRITAADLRDRNARVAATLRRTYIWFTLGIVLIVFALLCYTWAAIPPLTYTPGANP